MRLGVALAYRAFVRCSEPPVASRPCGLQSRDAFAPVALLCTCLRGAACAIPRRAVLGAPCMAGQGWCPDCGWRGSGPIVRTGLRSARVVSPGARAGSGWCRLIALLRSPCRVAARPGPGHRDPASRARCALGTRPPAMAVCSRQLPARETLPRAVPVAACAVLVFFLAIVGVRCAGQSTGSQPSLGCDGQRVACWSSQCARLCRSQGL